MTPFGQLNHDTFNTLAGTGANGHAVYALVDELWVFILKWRGVAVQIAVDLVIAPAWELQPREKSMEVASCRLIRC
jgi:hypothetical protein